LKQIEESREERQSWR